MGISTICILFIAINQHPKYPVIICANRDEFHQRPTQAMHFWQDENIIAGKDLQAGGTWLGTKEKIDQIFKFSALTNYRQVDTNKSATQSGTKVPPPSRGELVLKALKQEQTDVKRYLDKHSYLYEGFNLIYGDIDGINTRLFCFDSKQQRQHNLDAGFHSICNGALDDIWPKMARGKTLLEHYIKQTADINIAHLFELMKDSTQASQHLLPNTGVPLEWEQRLSSIFIQSPEYGTRSTTILTSDADKNLNVYQQEYNADGELHNNVIFRR